MEDIFKFQPTEEMRLRLMDAVKQDEISTVMEFLKFVKPEKLKWIFGITDNIKRNLLHLAAWEGSHKSISQLVKYKDMIHFNIDTPDENGDTPLSLACIGDYEDDTQTHRHTIVKTLLDKGAKLLPYTNRETNNPLHWACYHGDKQLVDVLLAADDSKALETHKNPKGWYPFDYLIPDFLEKIDLKNEVWSRRIPIGQYLLQRHFDCKEVCEIPLTGFWRKRGVKVAPAIEPDISPGSEQAKMIPSSPEVSPELAKQTLNEMKEEPVISPPAEQARPASRKSTPNNTTGTEKNKDLLALQEVPEGQDEEEKVYTIPDYNDWLDDDKELDHHRFLFWALTNGAETYENTRAITRQGQDEIKYEDHRSYLDFFLSQGVSPFRPSFNDQ